MWPTLQNDPLLQKPGKDPVAYLLNFPIGRHELRSGAGLVKWVGPNCPDELSVVVGID